MNWKKVLQPFRRSWWWYLLHGPGQVGIALFAPMEKLRHINGIGGFLERFEFGLRIAVQSLSCATTSDSNQPGIFGRSDGAAVSFAVRRGLSGTAVLSISARIWVFIAEFTRACRMGMKKRTMGSVQAEIRRKVHTRCPCAIVQSLADNLVVSMSPFNHGVQFFKTLKRMHVRKTKVPEDLSVSKNEDIYSECREPTLNTKQTRFTAQTSCATFNRNLCTHLTAASTVAASESWRGGGHGETAGLIEELELETVCSSAKYPNRLECWSSGTATFMILGNVCTRPCGFCSVPKENRRA